MATLNCPDADRLRIYLLGYLPVDEAREMEEHFLACPVCQETTTVLPVDPLLAALGRKPSLVDVLAESAEEEVVRRLRQDVPPFLPTEEWRLDGYRLVRRIGSGGMGVVYEAEDEQLQRRVAVKFMAAHLATDEAARERFLREARAAAAVQSDHVVAIYHVGLATRFEAHAVPYLVMPLLAGETLEAVCRRNPSLPIAEVIRIGFETAQGLAAAHEAGLIHRDIKPGNLWVEEGTGRIKILDFGLVRRQTDAVDLTECGAVVGTPAYLAPEQAAGGAVDPRADLFSLGCVLYRLCTGRQPFARTTVFDLLRAIATETPTAPHLIRPEVPRALSDLIVQMLEKDPQRRPASAEQVELALLGLAGPAGAKFRRRPRRRWDNVLLIALGLILATGLGLWLHPGNTPTPMSPSPELVHTPAPLPTEEQPKPALVPRDVQVWTVGVGRVEVKPTDAGGKPWDAPFWLGDRPEPDLYVDLDRVDPILRERIKTLQAELRPLEHRQAMQNLVASQERRQAQMDANDPQLPKLLADLRRLKERAPPLTEPELLQRGRLEQEIASLLAKCSHRTPVTNNSTQADFNSGAVPVAVGDKLVIHVRDSDGLAPAQLIGKIEVAVTEAMLSEGFVERTNFEQVILLRLEFSRRPNE